MNSLESAVVLDFTVSRVRIRRHRKTNLFVSCLLQLLVQINLVVSCCTTSRKPPRFSKLLLISHCSSNLCF